MNNQNPTLLDPIINGYRTIFEGVEDAEFIKEANIFVNELIALLINKSHMSGDILRTSYIVSMYLPSLGKDISIKFNVADTAAGVYIRDENAIHITITKPFTINDLIKIVNIRKASIIHEIRHVLDDHLNLLKHEWIYNKKTKLSGILYNNKFKSLSERFHSASYQNISTEVNAHVSACIFNMIRKYMSNGNLPKFEEILTYYFGNDNPDIPWYDKLTIDNKRRVIKRLYVIYDAIRLINNYINECETPVRNITAMSGNRHLIQLLKHEKNEIRKNIIDIIIDDLKQNITLTECTELGSYITPDTPSFLFEAEYISNEEFRDEFESKYIINGICKIPHLRSSYNRLNAQQTQSLEW